MSVTDKGGASRVADAIEELLQGAIERSSPVGTLRRRWREIASLHEEQALRPKLMTPRIWNGDDSAPALHHSECLSTMDWKESEGRVPEKAVHHLKMLGWAIEPGRRNFEPKVTIVVLGAEDGPAARWSLASCLSQSHEQIEILSAGDCSFAGDPRLKSLGPVGAGLAEEWNAGARMASGDFIQFLHAGDELSPNAIEEKLAQFAASPWARLCLGPVEQVGEPLRGRELAVDPYLRIVGHFPLDLSEVVAPTWLIRQGGPIKDSPAGSGVPRWWLEMLRPGLKVAEAPRAKVKRPTKVGKTSSDLVAAAERGIEADLACAGDLMGSPKLFRYIPPLVERATNRLESLGALGMAAAKLAGWNERIASVEGWVIGDGGARDGAGFLLLDQFLVSLKEKERRVSADDPMLACWRQRIDRLTRGLAGCPRITGADLKRWLPDVPLGRYENLDAAERSAVGFALGQLQSSALLGMVSIPFRLLAKVGADYPGHPYENYWSAAVRLARVLGDEPARQFCRRRFYRQGWRWLGQARRVLTRRVS